MKIFLNFKFISIVLIATGILSINAMEQLNVPSHVPAQIVADSDFISEITGIECVQVDLRQELEKVIKNSADPKFWRELSCLMVRCEKEAGLIDYAAKLFMRYFGHTALHQIVKLNYDFLVKPLIDNGVNVNAQDDKGQTPLYLATEEDQETSCAVLISNGADDSITDNSGKTVAMLLAERLERKRKAQARFQAFWEQSTTQQIPKQKAPSKNCWCCGFCR